MLFLALWNKDSSTITDHRSQITIMTIIVKNFEILPELPKCDPVIWSEPNTLGKMALMDLFNAGLPQTLNLLNTQHVWRAIQWDAIKQSLPVLKSVSSVSFYFKKMWPMESFELCGSMIFLRGSTVWSLKHYDKKAYLQGLNLNFATDNLFLGKTLTL